MTDDRLRRELAAMLAAGGPSARLCEIERAKGHHVLPVGVTIPFALDANDWEPDSVVSLDGRRVLLVLINAREPGTGALSRLVRTIQRAGFTPVVVAPIGQAMPAILKHWGWHKTVKGTGFESSEEWTP